MRVPVTLLMVLLAAASTRAQALNAASLVPHTPSTITTSTRSSDITSSSSLSRRLLQVASPAPTPAPVTPPAVPAPAPAPAPAPGGVVTGGGAPLPGKLPTGPQSVRELPRTPPQLQNRVVRAGVNRPLPAVSGR